MPAGSFGYDQSGNLVAPTNSDQMKLALILGSLQASQGVTVGQFGVDQNGNEVTPTTSQQMILALILGALQGIAG